MKRARTTNFSAEEELLLVEEIKKHGAIENKTTNKFSHRERVKYIPYRLFFLKI